MTPLEQVSKMKDWVRMAAGRLDSRYWRVYTWLSGKHPDLYPWHFQWHGTRSLSNGLRKALGELEGEVLDFGCGSQPYRGYLPGSAKYFGVDISFREGVDAVVKPGERLPFADGRFDAVLSTQVLEHVEMLPGVIQEIHRVLRDRGRLVVSVPFIFQVHGAPYDFRRFTEFGLRETLTGFSIIRIARLGGIGSSLSTLFLNWVDAQTSRVPLLWGMRICLMPLWMLVTLVVNAIGALLDQLDGTDAFYGNVLICAEKTPEMGETVYDLPTVLP